MFNAFKAAREYFSPKTINGNLCIDVGKARDILRKVDTIATKASIQEIVIDLNLNHSIIARGKNQTVLSDLSINNGYNCRKHSVYIDYEQLLAFDNISNLIREHYENDPNCLDAIESELSTDSTNVVINVIEKHENKNVLLQSKSEQKIIATMLYYKGVECPILDIPDNEKFSDTDGNTFDIEIRGKHEIDFIYFKAEDIAAMFEMSKLVNNISCKESYVVNKHYVILSIDQTSDQDLLPKSKLGSDAQITNDTKNRRMFLTWDGLFKVLFSSNSGNKLRQKMATWVTKTMFIHQYGNEEERTLLANNLVKAYKICLNSKSGIYLNKIGKVKDLRESMHISKDKYPDDNMIVCKYGKSNDMIRRFLEHSSKTSYGSYGDVSVLSFAFIHVDYITECENALKYYVNSNNIKFEFTDSTNKRHDELIIGNTYDIGNFKKCFSELITIHSSKSDTELARTIIATEQRHELEITKLTSKISLLEKDNDCLQLNLDKSNKISALQIENLQLKLMIAKQ